MGSSAGRRDKRYLAAKALFQTGRYPCRYNCGRPGTTPDHEPPLETATHWRLWQGQLLPACPTCQAKQGAAITNSRKRPEPSRVW